MKRMEQVNRFLKQLGIQDDLDNITKIVPYLEKYGARKVYYREDLRSIPEIGNRGLILPGGNVIVITVNRDGSKAVLVQIRENSEIGFPGGAIEEWEYNGKRAVEPTIVAAYREFYEETGNELHHNLHFYDENVSTILYPNGDIIYGLSTFYIVELPYEEVIKYVGKESNEGKIKLIKVKDVSSYKIFENHLPIFERLKEEYS